MVVAFFFDRSLHDDSVKKYYSKNGGGLFFLNYFSFKQNYFKTHSVTQKIGSDRTNRETSKANSFRNFPIRSIRTYLLGHPVLCYTFEFFFLDIIVFIIPLCDSNTDLRVVSFKKKKVEWTFTKKKN